MKEYQYYHHITKSLVRLILLKHVHNDLKLIDKSLDLVFNQQWVLDGDFDKIREWADNPVNAQILSNYWHNNNIGRIFDGFMRAPLAREKMELFMKQNPEIRHLLFKTRNLEIDLKARTILKIKASDINISPETFNAIKENNDANWADPIDFCAIMTHFKHITAEASREPSSKRARFAGL